MMRSTGALPVLAALAASLAGNAAQAHVVLQPGAAAPGGVVAARLIVGHGCSGQPTTAVRVEIPRGVPMVHPMEAEGWTLKVSRSGARVTAIAWTATGPGKDGPATFEAHMQLPAQAGRIYFPTRQSCGKTRIDWKEHGVEGAETPKRPAPSIDVGGAPAPAQDHGDHHG